MTRFLSGLAIWVASLLMAGPAAAQGLDPTEAINRCERFVEESLRPEIGTQFKSSYKMVCYFGLVDADIHERTIAVCDRVAAVLGVGHSVIASFACQGAYEIYRRDIVAAQ